MTVEAQLIGVSVGLAEELRRHGFRLSAKSAIVSHPPKLAKRVAEALLPHGIHLQTPSSAKDLGVATHGTRRSTVIIKGRMQKAARRALAIRRLVRVEPKARALTNTGYRPQAIWGHEGQGLAPSTLRRLRGQIAGMSGCLRPGGCATTSIRITFGADSDPHLLCRRQLFDNWLYILDALQEDDRALQLAWKKTVANLTSAKHRWQRVKGTMAAVIATLLDLQWQPTAAYVWTDSDGEQFELLRCDRERLMEFALRGAAEEATWKRASRWHLGGGLAGGVDFTIVRRHLRQLRSRGDHGRAAVLEMVATAALWPATRRLGLDGLEDQLPLEAHHAASAPACSASLPESVPPHVHGIDRAGKDSAASSGGQTSVGLVRAPRAHEPRPSELQTPDSDLHDTASIEGAAEARTEDGGIVQFFSLRRPLSRPLHRVCALGVTRRPRQLSTNCGVVPPIAT